MNKRETVVSRADGFNEVHAWTTPNGELVIHLSHRATNDEDVLIRIPTEDDVILAGMCDTASEEAGEDWDDETTQLGRLNHGGNWNA